MPANGTAGGGWQSKLIKPRSEWQSEIKWQSLQQICGVGSRKTLPRTEVDHNLTVVWADGCACVCAR